MAKKETQAEFERVMAPQIAAAEATMKAAILEDLPDSRASGGRFLLMHITLSRGPLQPEGARP